MKIRFTKQVGAMTFEIEEEAATQADIFDVVEFWSSLPDKGPSGETDLRFAHRVAQGFDFYEITSDSGGKRFCFGQRKEGKGVLFPKGWEDVYHGDRDEREEERHRPRAVPNAGPKASPRPQNTSTEKDIEASIREKFGTLGINNAGQEKSIVMRALNMRAGCLVAELGRSEKEDLQAYLIEQIRQQPRSAAGGR